MNKYLIVIDMQNDFIGGNLGTARAQEILSSVVKKVSDFDGTVLYTMDTHDDDYLTTSEGKSLPVVHCIKGTDGWKVPPSLNNVLEEKHAVAFEKLTFGSVKLAQHLAGINESSHIDSIEFVGVCTDICVVSNALLIKAYLPEVPITVDSSCCAGVTPEKHLAALETMRSCQINVI